MTRIFDLFDELPFAGHPIIEAATILHQRLGDSSPQSWQVDESGGAVEILTQTTASGLSVRLGQGAAEFLGARDDVAAALNLTREDLAPDLPMEVVSTGLAI